MFHKALLAGLALTAGLLLSPPSFADACSSTDHTGGTLLSALSGGLLGGAVSDGHGGAVIGGALLGGLADNAIARDLDCADRRPAVRAYDQSLRSPVGRRAEWKRGPNRGYIVTHREYYQGSRLCRDFTHVVYRKGRQFDRAGSACLRRDGQWEFV